MEIKEFSISGPLLMTLKSFDDARGFFLERFKKGVMSEVLPGVDFIQDNFSRSATGVLRGLHYQFSQPQGKLVTCVHGEIFDVAVDIRKDSKTFGQHLNVNLSGEKPQWLWIPAGFAHGFCVVGDEPADVMYKVNALYNPQGEKGLLWNDLDLAIVWPLAKPSLSPKDEILSDFSQYRKDPKF